MVNEEHVNAIEAIVDAIQNHVPCQVSDVSDDILARKILNAISPFMNTRPAAPVEGLERYDLEDRSHFNESSYMRPDETGEYVRFDQAEAIIAARDAEIERLQKINAMIMGDDEDKPRYTTKRLKHEIARATEALETQLAAANKRADELEAAWLKAEALLSEAALEAKP